MKSLEFVQSGFIKIEEISNVFSMDFVPSKTFSIVFMEKNGEIYNIYEDINDEIKDEKVSLDDKINHYATVKMADNGNGVMVKGV